MHENKNFGGRGDLPGSDEQKIAEMLSGLKRVEAPKDFDFKLKARIAQANPGVYRKTRLFPVLRFAMPLGLFLAVGAGILINSSYSDSTSPQIAADAPPAASIVSESPVPARGQEEVASSASSGAELPTNVQAPVAGQQIASGAAAQRGTLQRPAAAGRTTAPAPAGFSTDRGVNPAPTPIVPPEFRQAPPANSSVRPKDMPVKPLGAREALASIGIEADVEENAFKVKTVKNGTLAGQMGVKPGDKLESIDGKEINDKTVFEDGSFRVKSIRVKRAGSAVQLEVPKPK
jgi:hypothetical protein